MTSGKRQVILTLNDSPFLLFTLFGVNEQTNRCNLFKRCILVFIREVITSIQRKPLFIMNDCFCSLWMKLNLVYMKWKEIIEEFQREEIGVDLTIEWSLLFTWIGLLLLFNIEAKEWIIWEYNHPHMGCWWRSVSFYHIKVNRGVKSIFLLSLQIQWISIALLFLWDLHNYHMNILFNQIIEGKEVSKWLHFIEGGSISHPFVNSFISFQKIIQINSIWN